LSQFLDALQEGKRLVSDGAMGTQLQSRGYPAGDSPEAWALEHEQVLRDIHIAYVEAGANLLTANSFGATSIKLAKFGLEDQVARLNREVARVAVSVTKSYEDRELYVGGDMGPTGEFLQPLGPLSEESLFAVYAEQAEALAAGGVDYIFVETMMDVNEAVVAVKASRASSGLPVMASMSFNMARKGFRTMMGNTPAQMVTALLEAGADVVGSNCGEVLAAQMPDLVREFKSAGASLVVVQPNAGIPESIDGKTVFSQSPEEMAASVPDILAAGANIIGGCCGTTPDHIRLIAQRVGAFCV